MKKIIIIFLSLFAIPAFASDWPTFSYPGNEQLLNLNYLTTRDCPRGEARLMSNASININQTRCHGYCPEDWSWKGKSDGRCHPLSDINFKGYQFTYVPKDYDWNYTTVTALYGAKNSGSIYFKFEMKTPDDEYWYCVLDSADSDFTSCANDF